MFSITVEYSMAIETGIVALAPDNSENELIPLQRALPPSREEPIVLAIESPPSPNSMFLIFFFEFLLF